MKIGPHDIGVCSWSLRQPSVADLVRVCGELGLSHVQLALYPLLEMPESQRQADLAALREAEIELTAGMVSFPGEDYTTLSSIRMTGGLLPDEHWPTRLSTLQQAAELAGQIGLRIVSTHVGFIPRSADPRYRVVLSRVQEVARAFDERGILLLMETGQERATELLQFLNDLPIRNVAVNFDPANMILYGAGDPLEAIHTLGRHIRHVHIKDAIHSDQPGLKWGEEVPFGRGQVNAKAFLQALASVDYTGPLVIEREAGPTRIADIRTAIETLQAAVA